MLEENNIFSFDYKLPTRIVFGRNTLEKTGEIIQEIGKKALIVTTKGGSMIRYGYLDKLTKSLGNNGIKYVVFNKVSTNPTTIIAWEASEMIKKENCDFVIGLGGGSAIDVAKIAAASSVTDIYPKEYTLGIKEIDNALPIVAIPTTHGTGTEVDKYAVLTDPETNAKRGIVSRKIYPTVSILDPILTLTLPKKLTAATTIDALSHALESYVKENATRLSMLCAEEAISKIFRLGPYIVKDLDDIVLRENLLWASMCAGISIDINGTTMCHGLEHPISALFNIHHGEGLAILMLPWIRYTRPAIEKKLSHLALLLGFEGETEQELSYVFIEKLSSLLDKMGLNMRLRDFNVKEKHIDLLVENAISFMGYNIDSNPRPASRSEIKEIYLKAL